MAWRFLGLLKCVWTQHVAASGSLDHRLLQGIIGDPRFRSLSWCSAERVTEQHPWFGDLRPIDERQTSDPFNPIISDPSFAKRLWHQLWCANSHTWGRSLEILDRTPGWHGFAMPKRGWISERNGRLSLWRSSLALDIRQQKRWKWI